MSLMPHWVKVVDRYKEKAQYDWIPRDDQSIIRMNGNGEMFVVKITEIQTDTTMLQIWKG